MKKKQSPKTTDGKANPKVQATSLNELSAAMNGPTMRCLSCNQMKPVAGSEPFHGWRVCGGCVVRLKTKKETI